MCATSALLKASKTTTVLQVRYETSVSAHPCNGESFLVVEGLSQQRLSVGLVHVYHGLVQKWNRSEGFLQRTSSLHHLKTLKLWPRLWTGMLTMFQNLSKATTKPEHTPLSPLKVLMWTLTLILSSTHRYSSPSGLPLDTEGGGKKHNNTSDGECYDNNLSQILMVVEAEPTRHPGQDVLLGFVLPPPRCGAALALLRFCHRVIDHQLLQPLDALRVGHPFLRLPLPLLHVLRLGPASASLHEALVLRHIVEALDVRERHRHGRRVQGRERVELVGAHVEFGCVVILRCSVWSWSMLRHWWRAGEARSRRVFAVCFGALPLALLHVWKPLPKNTWRREGWRGKRLRRTELMLLSVFVIVANNVTVQWWLSALEMSCLLFYTLSTLQKPPNINNMLWGALLENLILH